MGKIIKVSNLIKNYGSVEAVKNISFEVEKGSLFAFLGTNGAGKSTTIDILSTLITKNSGSVVINEWELGKDDQKIRKDIGVVFQNSVLDNLLTVRENLSIRGSFYGLSGSALKERISEASKITECDEFMDRRYGKLSGGQKRRADIARALINQPKILFLDEPTTGLDPKTRTSIWNTIGEMQRHLGMTVFLTTHYMEEAANADTITIINQGKIVAEGTPNNLKEKYTDDLLKIYDAEDEVVRYLNEKKIPHSMDKNVVSVNIKAAESAINILADLKGSITSFEMIHGNMDDVFLKAIGQSREEAEC
ncbi:ATP-binding cassette domain-containing protein [Clostridium sp. BNL1100]|uniref:ABC transporter ATP-binding protein n=1 Tax=Clostridium sp. BNL1100 TaxID=755731 RepID=UPI00024A7D01|nr:ATP-binding cassette domain-containing protein [Clostridium sp. BNL1100]AEY67079.1 ABC-type multidrug transport system, ATPase component [Clostridium sp. BNL1100]